MWVLSLGLKDKPFRETWKKVSFGSQSYRYYNLQVHLESPMCDHGLIWYIQEGKPIQELVDTEEEKEIEMDI